MAVKHWAKAAIAKLPNPQYWLWPIAEVGFIATFSIIPLFVFAFVVYVKSVPTIPYFTALSNLLLAGQLMFYSVGFLASSSWLLIYQIQWPRLLKPFLLLLIFAATIVFAITVGVDPTAQSLNREAFRTTSYWTFGVSLALYLSCEILGAVQPLRTAEQQFKSDSDRFVQEVEQKVAEA